MTKLDFTRAYTLGNFTGILPLLYFGISLRNAAIGFVVAALVGNAIVWIPFPGRDWKGRFLKRG